MTLKLSCGAADNLVLMIRYPLSKTLVDLTALNFSYPAADNVVFDDSLKSHPKVASEGVDPFVF